jgi:tRNA dimethylallyltransferase
MGDPVTAAPLVVLCGPTGTGKSRLSLALAERVGGEVVNADSMQLYRGMDVGTAKVPVDERRGVPHHLLDVLDIAERASVAVYQRDARAAVGTIRARGRTPILVGGSGLYVQAVIDEIDFPATDPELRAALQRRAEQIGAAGLHARLAELDPAAAAAIEPANARRIVRALEVIELTGRPFTASLPRPGPPRYDAVLLRLDRETQQLDRLLGDRVRAMMAAGFLDEVVELERQGLRRGVTACRALGYRQLLDVLDGSRTLGDAVSDTVAATRRFVRRQRSWFRRDRRMIELDAADPALVDRALAALRAPDQRFVGRTLGP